MSFLSYNVVVSTAEGDGRQHREILSTLVLKIDLIDFTTDGNQNLRQDPYLLKHRKSVLKAEVCCSSDDNDNHCSKALSTHSGTTCSTGYDTFFDNGFEFVDDETTAGSDTFSSCSSQNEIENEYTTSNRSQDVILTQTEDDENSVAVGKRRALWRIDTSGASPLQHRSSVCLDAGESTSFLRGTSALISCDQSVSESQIETEKTRSQATASTLQRRSSWPTRWGSARRTLSGSKLCGSHGCPQDQDESSCLPDQQRLFIHGKDCVSSHCESAFYPLVEQPDAQQRTAFDPTFNPDIEPIWRGHFEYEELRCEEAKLIEDKELFNLLEKTLRETDIGSIEYIHAHLRIEGDDESDDGLSEEMSSVLSNLDCLHCEEAGLIADKKLKLMIGMTMWETDINCLDYVDAHYYSPWYEDIDDSLTDELKNLASITEAIKWEIEQIRLEVDEHDRIGECISIDDLSDIFCRLQDNVTAIMKLHLPVGARPIKEFRHLWSHRVRIRRPGSSIASFFTESHSNLNQLSMESDSSVSRDCHPNVTCIGPHPPEVLFEVDALKLATGVGKYLLQTNSNEVLYKFLTLMSDEVLSYGRVVKSHSDSLTTASSGGVQKIGESVLYSQVIGGSHPTSCKFYSNGNGESDQPQQKIRLHDLFSAFAPQTWEPLHGRPDNPRGSYSKFAAILLRPESDRKRVKGEASNAMAASPSELHLFRNATGDSDGEDRKDGASFSLLVRRSSPAQNNSSPTSTARSHQGTLSPVESYTAKSLGCTWTLAAASNLGSLCPTAQSSTPNESNVSRTLLSTSAELSSKHPDRGNVQTRVSICEMQNERLLADRFSKQRSESSLGLLVQSTEIPWEITFEADDVSVDSEMSPVTYRDKAFDRQEEHFFRLSHLLDCDIQYERPEEFAWARINFGEPESLIRVSGAQSTVSTSGSLSLLLSSSGNSKDPILEALDAALDPPRFDGALESDGVVCDLVQCPSGIPFRSSSRADCKFDCPVTNIVRHALSVDENFCEISRLLDLRAIVADTSSHKEPSDPSAASSDQQVEESFSMLGVEPADYWVAKSEFVKSEEGCFQVLCSADPVGPKNSKKPFENVEGSTWVSKISDNGRSGSQDKFSSQLPYPRKNLSPLYFESSFHEIEVSDLVYSPLARRHHRISLSPSSDLDTKSAGISEHQAPAGAGLPVNQTQATERNKVDMQATAFSDSLPCSLAEPLNLDVVNSSFTCLVPGVGERYSEAKSSAINDDKEAESAEGLELKLRINDQQAPTLPLHCVGFGAVQSLRHGRKECSTYCGKLIKKRDDMIERYVDPSTCHGHFEERIEVYEVTVQDFFALSQLPSTCCDVDELPMPGAQTDAGLLFNHTQAIEGNIVHLSATALADSLPRDPIECCNSDIENSSFAWLAAGKEEIYSELDSKASDYDSSTEFEEGFELELQLSNEQAPTTFSSNVFFDAFQTLERSSEFFLTSSDYGESILEEGDIIIRHVGPCHCELEDENEEYQITVQDIGLLTIQPSPRCDGDENACFLGQVDGTKPQTCHKKDFAICSTNFATNGARSFEDTTFPERVLVVGEAVKAAGDDSLSSIREVRVPTDLANIGIVAKDFAVEVEMCPNTTEHRWEQPRIYEEIIHTDPNTTGRVVHIVVEQCDLDVEIEFMEDVCSGQLLQDCPNLSFWDQAGCCSALGHPFEWDEGKPKNESNGESTGAQSSSLAPNNVLGSIELSIKEAAHQVMMRCFSGGECSKSARDRDSIDFLPCSSQADSGMQSDSDIAYSSISKNYDFSTYQCCMASLSWFTRKGNPNRETRRNDRDDSLIDASRHRTSLMTAIAGIQRP
jgi:hypothetical protein